MTLLRLDKPAAWRPAAWSLLGLFLLWAMGAMALRARFDDAHAAGLLTDWMQARYQRALTIEEPLRLGLFPRLEVRGAGVRLADPDRPDRETVSMAEMRAGIGLWALLRGELEIDRLSAQGVTLNLRRDAKGRSNLDDLFRAQEDGATSPLRWNVRSLAIQEVRVRIRDEATPLEGELTLPHLQTGPLENGKASLLSLQAQVNMKQPLLQGELRLLTHVIPDLADASVRCRGLDMGWTGDTAWANGMQARLTGDLGWRIAQEAFDLQQLQLSLSATTPGGLKLVDSRLSAAQIHYDAPAQALRLSELSARLQGVLKDGAVAPGGGPRQPSGRPLKFELDWPLLEVSARALQGSPVKGRLTLGGERTLNATFQSAAPQGQFKAIVVPGFETVFTQEERGRKLNGLLRTQLTLQPAATALVLDQIDGQFKLQETGLQPLGLTMQGRLQANAQQARWTLEGQCNASPCDTSGQVIYTTTPPQVQLQARIDELDLNRLLGPPTPPSPKAAAAAGRDTIDLSPLRTLNGQFKLRAGTLAYRDTRVTELGAEASLEAGILRVTSLGGRGWGGRIDLTGLADARASRVALQGLATGVDIHGLLRDLVGQDLPLAGTARLAFDLDTAGRSRDEMASRLQGKADLQVRNGALGGADLLQRLRQARLPAAPVPPPPQAPAKALFSELNTRLSLADGMAGINALDIRGTLLHLTGEGWIDLAPRRLDLVMRAGVTPPSKGPEATEWAALRGATVPVRLAGPLDKLVWQVDMEVAQGAGAAVGSASAAFGGPLKSRLNDKLRGLMP